MFYARIRKIKVFNNREVIFNNLFYLFAFAVKRL
jgi:hypothetical protein